MLKYTERGSTFMPKSERDSTFEEYNPLVDRSQQSPYPGYIANAIPAAAVEIIEVQPFELLSLDCDNDNGLLRVPSVVPNNSNETNISALAREESLRRNEKILRANEADGRSIVRRDVEATMLSQRDGAYVSSYIEKQILASNYRDTDPRRNDMGATLAYPVPTAPPQFPERLPVPSYAIAAPSYSGQGYDTTEYRSIYDPPSSTSSSSSAPLSSSGGYQCQEYKSIYEK